MKSVYKKTVHYLRPDLSGPQCDFSKIAIRLEADYISDEALIRGAGNLFVLDGIIFSFRFPIPYDQKTCYIQTERTYLFEYPLYRAIKSEIELDF